jgi:hypothetical protein
MIEGVKSIERTPNSIEPRKGSVDSFPDFRWFMAGGSWFKRPNPVTGGGLRLPRARQSGD